MGSLADVRDIGAILLAVLTIWNILNSVRLRRLARLVSKVEFDQLRRNVEQLQERLDEAVQSAAGKDERMEEAIQAVRELALRNGEQISALTGQINRLVVVQEETSLKVSELAGSVKLLVDFRLDRQP